MNSESVASWVAIKVALSAMNPKKAMCFLEHPHNHVNVCCEHR